MVDIISFYQVFFDNDELIAILQSLHPLIEDLKHIIINKIIDDIVSEEITNMTFADNNYDWDDLDIDDYYSFY